MSKNKIFTLYKILYKTYGQQGWWSLINYDKKDVNSLDYLKTLNALTPQGIKNLDQESFKLAIKPSGYFNQKSKYILDFLHFFETLNGTTPTREALLGIKGIGEETAESILLYAYNQEEFVVDAYTKRVLFSLKLISEKSKYEEVKATMQEALESCIPKVQRIKVYQEYHALIVHHAKNHYSRKPYGKECMLHLFVY